MKKLIFSLLALSAVTMAKAQMQQTSQGAQYQIFTQSTGPKIKVGDIVTLNLINKTEKDSVLFSTYTAGAPTQVQVQPTQNIADLMAIFPLLSNKDSVLVKIPADSVFKNQEDKRPPFFPAKSNIVFVIKIEKIQSLNEAIAERNASMAKLQAAEPLAITKYITANKLMPKTTASGLKYVILSLPEKGSGRKPLPGDTVMVNYVGRTLEGKVFDSSVQMVAKEAGLDQPGRNYEPIRFVVGAGQMIPGWDEGFQYIPEGAAAKLILPSKLAYGERGAPPTIAPYSPLVFDVNLLRIYPTKHPVVAAKPAAKKTTAKKTTTTKKVTHK
ncbi:FKBP-type peptidyl-prolyl cis-trans isomerase [Mucilaginibacter sp. KACC 22063]|uniref:FKBP-type peptidyl-prolyl cis-trans isomerase n=1 Tax=Mucilaginibacter sp. KACC 22063 TaxID=3025666 RepID=UPI0023665BC3|nr:FKBP-type peptidyl-prolyl cis-trans isomerase [Mucilaginibacter sp. KACC 22063]WDF55618.1 FKBP-type peptidyl-prolyl cis-trans isomerase [Mucilaginibacter sp. KACC 22063]